MSISVSAGDEPRRRSATQGPVNIISPAQPERRKIDLDRALPPSREKRVQARFIELGAFRHAEAFDIRRPGCGRTGTPWRGRGDGGDRAAGRL